MLVLAIETTEKAGSVALLDRSKVLRERQLDPNQRSAQSLAPAIAELLQEAGRAPGEIKLVAVASGPGSFTGLRVGVTTAKMFAYATSAAVLGVNALEAIARQTQTSARQLWAVMDAQRNELFAEQFKRDSAGQWVSTSACQIIANDTWLASLTTDTAVSGPGLTKLIDRIPAGVVQVERALWTPQAAMIGQIAIERFNVGIRDDAFQLVPQYLRRSAAEEKQSQNQPTK